MQKYRPKTVAAEVSDRLLRICITCLAGVGWFVCLWGVTLASLTAGAALGILLWLCVRQFAKRITQKREQQMRRILGGEAALEQLLLENPQKSACLCALWLNLKFPDFEMQKAADWCVYGMLDGHKTVIRLIAQHPSVPINIQQIIECTREAREQEMEKIILCLTAPVSAEVKEFSFSLSQGLTLVERKELIDLAGYTSPATDDLLRQLAKRKRTRRSPKEWLTVVLDQSRCRRYFWYGISLCALSMITGNTYYPIPGILCLLLFAGCKAKSLMTDGRRHWKA